MRRLLGAVVSQRSDAAVPQMRRSAGAIGAGVAIAALLLAIFAAIGLISPSAPDWRRSDAVIVEKETGARFVYLDGVLHPVLNYTSARLIVGGGATTVSVSHADLAGATRGTPLGIPGAPDSLPGRTDLLAGGWSVCTDTRTPTATVIGGGVTGGEILGDRAILAETSNHDEYLLWHGRRFLIADPAVVVPVPLKGAGSPRPVSDVVINALPAGSDLKAITVDRGHPSWVDSLATGTVVYTGDTADSRIYGLVRLHDVVIITPLQKDILGDEGAGEPRRVDQRTFAGAAPSLGLGVDWPATTPTFATGDASLCVGVSPRGTSTVTLGATIPTGAAPGGNESRLVIAPGRGALVRPVAAPGSAGTVAAAPTYLLTDDGERFPIADGDSLSSLGYASARVMTLPSDVLNTLPMGVTLSRTAARRTAGS
jgi:type VII secretion protein EccB